MCLQVKMLQPVRRQVQAWKQRAALGAAGPLHPLIQLRRQQVQQGVVSVAVAVAVAVAAHHDLGFEQTTGMLPYGQGVDACSSTTRWLS